MKPAFLNWALENTDLGLKLYHYSDTQFDVLKTRALTGTITPEMIKQGKEDMAVYKNPGPYYDHISFFFERPPIDKMSKVFGKDHPFWYPGHEVYEHIVDIDSLPAMKYLLTESPEVTKVFYDPQYDNLSYQEYFELIYRIRIKNKEIGSSVRDLRSVIKSMKGETERNYMMLRNRPNFDDIKNKYAASVPHLMIYPVGGQINILTTNKVIIH